MKKRSALRLGALTVVIFILVSSLSSCLLMGSGASGDYISREELDRILSDQMTGDVTIEESNNYEVNIHNSGNPNVTAAAKGLLSTVRVIAKYVTSNPYTGSSTSTQEGAGVIFRLDKEGGDAYIITNYHVIYNSRAISNNYISNQINVRLYGMDSDAYDIQAEYVGGSMTLDLAVLKVTSSRILAESNAVAATFADSDNVAVLDTAIAIGNPAAGGISATVGSVSVDGEYITMTAADGASMITLRLFRIDTAVNSGNSGGGLFNDRGELIGIVNAKLSSSSIDNIGYAIPSNVVKHVADNILDYCDGTQTRENPYKVLLGINMTVTDLYSEYDTETGRVQRYEVVTVGSVTEGSVADGLFLEGDVIRHIIIDNTRYTIDRMHQVTDCMFAARPYSDLQIIIDRNGDRMIIDVPLDEVEPTLVK